MIDLIMLGGEVVDDFSSAQISLRESDYQNKPLLCTLTEPVMAWLYKQQAKPISSPILASSPRKIL